MTDKQKESAAACRCETQSPPETVHITINGFPVEAHKGETVLLAARRAGFDIPTLCYMKDVNAAAACRICVVEAEVNGRPFKNLPASCILEVQEGMVIRTNTERVRRAVRLNLELILANHNRECLICIRNGRCELQALCRKMGVDTYRFEGDKRPSLIDDRSFSIVRDPSKCILCGRCVSECANIQGIGILNFTHRGFVTEVAPAYGYSMADVECVYCGQCIEACPVGALHEHSYINDVFAALEAPEKHVVVQVAPSVRAALGEEFGYPVGSNTEGKMFAALRRMGFDKIFDTNFSADLTIMEEANELIHRVREGGKLPMITSCSPGWVRFCEFNFHDFLDNLSTCKSPQQMMGAVIKSYYAEREHLDPANIVSVAFMPCTSKKTEARQKKFGHNKFEDIDIVLTTRELAAMIRQAGIDFDNLPDESADPLFDQYSGAGAIFGATGGVMEAALRTAADILSGQEIEAVDYTMCRDLEGIKEGSVTLSVDGQDVTLNIAVAHGTANAARLLQSIRRGEKQYHFIEVMACPGGCVNGGGQPIVTAKERLDHNALRERAAVLYKIDKDLPLRKSHENPEIIKLYKDFLGEPNGHLAHELLHTHYQAREIYPLDAVRLTAVPVPEEAVKDDQQAASM